MFQHSQRNAARFEAFDTDSIDEREIDATMPEMKEYAEALVKKTKEYKCLTEIKRWEYKEADPLLKLELK